jgi:hypothetical protein
MVRPERFELPTTWFVARYSIQLSYGRDKMDKCRTGVRLYSTGELQKKHYVY